MTSDNQLCPQVQNAQNAQNAACTPAVGLKTPKRTKRRATSSLKTPKRQNAKTHAPSKYSEGVETIIRSVSYVKFRAPWDWDTSVSKPDTLVRFHFVQGYAAGLCYGGRTVLHCHVSHKMQAMFSHCRTDNSLPIKRSAVAELPSGCAEVKVKGRARGERDEGGQCGHDG